MPFVRDGLKLYKDQFLSSLPTSRRGSADFTRPMFTAVALYLCAKKHKVSTTMKDLCHDVFGVAKEKKDPKEVKTNRDLLDVLPNKRKAEDGGYMSDDGAELYRMEANPIPMNLYGPCYAGPFDQEAEDLPQPAIIVGHNHIIDEDLIAEDYLFDSVCAFCDNGGTLLRCQSLLLLQQ